MASARLAHDDTDEIFAIAPETGCDIEAGGTRITRLDPINALHAAEQAIVVPVFAALVVEVLGLEDAVVLRVVLQNVHR